MLYKKSYGNRFVNEDYVLKMVLSENEYDLIKWLDEKEIDLLKDNFKCQCYNEFCVSIKFFGDNNEIIKMIKNYRLLNNI
jgi:hypothetical protein